MPEVVARGNRDPQLAAPEILDHYHPDTLERCERVPPAALGTQVSHSETSLAWHSASPNPRSWSCNRNGLDGVPHPLKVALINLTLIGLFRRTLNVPPKEVGGKS